MIHVLSLILLQLFERIPKSQLTRILFYPSQTSFVSSCCSLAVGVRSMRSVFISLIYTNITTWATHVNVIRPAILMKAFRCHIHALYYKRCKIYTIWKSCDKLCLFIHEYMMIRRDGRLSGVLRIVLVLSEKQNEILKSVRQTANFIMSVLQYYTCWVRFSSHFISMENSWLT